MGVDVLITGHTHRLSIWQGEEGGLYINPGSVRDKQVVKYTQQIGPITNMLTSFQIIRLMLFAQATGAYTTTEFEVAPPSFVLVDVQGSKVVTYSYFLNGTVRAKLSESYSCPSSFITFLTVFYSY